MVAVIDLQIPIGSDDEQPSVVQLTGKEPQRKDRGSVCPVEIIQHDEHRPPLGRAEQRTRERVEQPQTIPLGVLRAGRRGCSAP